MGKPGRWKDRVHIAVSGRAADRLLQRIAGAGIPVWDVSVKGETVYAVLSRKDAAKLPPLVRGSGCRIRFLHARGPVALWHKWRWRRMFLAGLVLCVLSLWLASGFIWRVEVSGEAPLLCQQANKWLQDNGIRPGMPLDGLQAQMLEKQLHLALEGAAWVGVHIRGTRVSVELQPLMQKPEVADDRARSGDVYAACDAVIRRLDVYSGIPVVQPGDAVKKGDLLIAGDDTGVRGSCARGNVTGAVLCTGIGESETVLFTLRDTGRLRREGHVTAGAYTLPLFSTGSSFPLERVEMQRVSLCGQLGIPLRYESATCFEQEPATLALTEAVARTRAGVKAWKKAISSLPEGFEIVDKTVEYSMMYNMGKVCAVISLEAEGAVGETVYR